MTRNKHLRRLAATVLATLALAAAAVVGYGRASAAETWNGLAVVPEQRCSPYDRAGYPYPQSVEARIVASMGGRVYGPYTGRRFRSVRETDIDHVVALSEAHDSGLCAAGPEHPPALRVGPAQSHPRGAGSEPLRWRWQMRP